MRIGYINVFVSDLIRARTFYTNVLGLTPITNDPEHGYLSFHAGTVSLGIAQTDDASLVGRHTGAGFMVEDIDKTYEELSSRGVVFHMPPTKQPWGGTLALFQDPDGNVYYLDPGGSH